MEREKQTEETPEQKAANIAKTDKEQEETKKRRAAEKLRDPNRS